MAGRGISRIPKASHIVILFVLLLIYPIAVLSVPTHYPDHKCATNAPLQTELVLNNSSVYVGLRTWGLTYLNQNIAFVAVNLSIGVIDTSDFTPKLKSLIPLPPEFIIGNDDVTNDGYGYRELTLTHDKLNLYIATGYGAVIVDVAKAVLGRTDCVAGVLSRNGYAGRSAIELSITRDDEYVFISQEFGSNITNNRGAIEVYNVTRLTNGTVISSWRGFIALDYGVTGQQFSSDHTKLFVSSEMFDASSSTDNTTGTLSVLDVAKLRNHPKTSLLTKVRAGCRPARCRMSPDGRHLWVTERDANQISVFDARRLANNKTTGVLLATANTGTSPIGVAIAGDYVFTADSNRFYYANATTGVTVVNATAAVADGQVTFPQIRTGAFPRSLAVSPDGNTLLVAEFGTGNVRTVNISSLNNG